jgi:integrase
MADYLDWMAVHRKAATNTRYQVDAHIVPEDALGPRPVAELTTREIRRWHQGLAVKPARLRSAKGKPPRSRTADRPDNERKRKTTANRVLAILKAGLNFAYREGRVPSDEAWRRVRPFKGVEAPRIRFLDREEARRLLNACDPDFRRLVQAALLTGCRYGELTRLLASDYSPDRGALYIRESKSNKARHVYLNDEGTALFDAATAGRSGAERIFLRADGGPWGKAHQIRRMVDVSATARVEPAVSFHILRHTYASLYLMNGGDLPALAQQLGHADTRMTVRHYSHLADTWRAEQARKHAPSLGLAPSTVVPLRRV